MFHVI